MTDQADRFERAIKVQERIYGSSRLKELAERGYRTKGLQDFTELTIAHCMLDLWDRPALDLRARSIAMVAGLMCMRQWEELEIHMGLALRNGVTPDELIETVLQMTVYGGQAIGHSAIGIATKVLKAADIDQRREGA